MIKQLIILLFFCFTFTMGANAQSIVGTWSGPIKLPQGDLPFVLKVTGQPGNYKATADSPKQDAYGIPVDTLILDENILRFAIEKLKVRYQGIFVHADSISGDFVQAGATYPLGFKRSGATKTSEETSLKVDSTVKKDSAVKEENTPLNEEEINDEVEEEAKVAAKTPLSDAEIAARIKTLEPEFEKVLQNYHAAGYAVAVVNKEGIIYSKGFGWRDAEHKKPITPNTLFPIGSSTKAFTAALVGKLEDEGKVSLDSPVVNYLPQLRFYADELTNKVTLRDMMSHRTGLARYDLAWYAFPTSSRDSLLNRIRFMKPNVGLREKWQYNNFMYLAQGMLAEHLSGQTWEKNIEKVFFKPLGMTRSNTSISALQQDVDAAIGYTVTQDSILKKVPYYNINAMGPAGSINSSVNELGDWVQLWLNGGERDGKEILSKNYVSDAASSQMVMSDGKPKGEHPDISFSNYGLGWMLSSYRGHYLVEHGGNIDGFSASVSFFPYDKLGIIVLSNQNGSSVPNVVRNLIADKVLDLPYFEWSKPGKDSSQEFEEVEVGDMGRVAGTQPSHKLKDYEGAATHPAFGTINFYTKNDSLFAKLPESSFWLKHYHYDVFEGKGIDKETGVADSTAGGIKFNFQANNDGAISGVGIRLEPSIKEPQVFQFLRGITLSDAELQKYEGAYDLSGLEIRVYIKNKHLYVAVPGQPDYKSTPRGAHKFSPDVLLGYTFAFEADEDGKIIAFYSIQPNGTFKAKKK